MRILVIDDDEAIGAALKLWLEPSGVQVQCVEGAKAGVQALKAAEFDLTMVDIYMPGISGIEAIKLLRAVKPELPARASELEALADVFGAAPSRAIVSAPASVSARIRDSACHFPLRLVVTLYPRSSSRTCAAPTAALASSLTGRSRQ